MAGTRLAVLAGLFCLVHISYCVSITPAPSSAAPPSTGTLTPVPSSAAPPSTGTITPVPSSTTSSSSMASSSSTTAAKTSTTTSPSPSPTSSPQPPAQAHNFTFREGNDTCAHVYATVQVEFTYENTSEKSVTKEFYATNLHPEVDYDISMCDTDAIELVISFYNDSSHVHYLTFTFKAEKDNKYQLKKITVDLDLTDEKLFPGYNQTENATVTGTTRDDDVFESSANRSYRCNSTRKFTLKQDPSDAGKKLVMKLSDFRAQAFHFKNEKTGAFDRSSRCSLDQKTSKIVPIAVGAALAGLVVVVLIAYLIGRFRSRKQNSYEALS